MDNKLLLTNGIVLLYRESQFAEATDNSSDLIKQIVESIKLPELSIGLDHEKNVLSGLKKTALGMCSNPPNHKYEVSELLLRLKVNCNEDEGLFDALRDGISVELSEESLRRICLNLRIQLRQFMDTMRITEIMHRATTKLKFEGDKIPDIRKFIANVTAELEPYQIHGDEIDPSIVDDIDFSNEDSVNAVYEDLKQQETGAKILKLGWQGINRMLQGGLRRGEAVLLSALQHNYKTGFGLSIFKHIALYNDPKTILNDPKKKPLLLRISFEDAAKNNMQFLYQSLYENEFKKAVPDFTELNAKEMTKYVRDKLQVNGWHIRIMRVDPTNWTYREIQNTVLKLEAEGYEVIVCELDYLALVPTTGCVIGPAGVDKRDLLRRTRNFMSRRDITFFTPHQMSTDAKNLLRNGNDDLVQEVAGKGYYEGSKQLDQEVDLELHIHIVKVNGKSYLTVQRGKHRVIRQTPDIDLYCVLPFEPIGGILDDINGPDTTRRRPGGGAIGSGEAMVPFWDVG